jgi:hypothetical protein
MRTVWCLWEQSIHRRKCHPFLIGGFDDKGHWFLRSGTRTGVSVGQDSLFIAVGLDRVTYKVESSLILSTLQRRRSSKAALQGGAMDFAEMRDSQRSSAIVCIERLDRTNCAIFGVHPIIH